jgi:hypothetical protein
MSKQTGLTLALAAAALLVSATAFATVPMMKQYAAHYPDAPKPKCVLCHTTNPKLNEYGEALKKELKGAKVITPEMFKACEAKRPKA